MHGSCEIFSFPSRVYVFFFAEAQIVLYINLFLNLLEILFGLGELLSSGLHHGTLIALDPLITDA